MVTRTFPMQDTGSGNLTTISHILLLGFGDLKELRLLLFTGFLAVYIISMAANLLLVVLDPHLQTPMYFFLSSLSCLQMVSTSNISPVMLTGLQTGNVMISLGGCLAQLYLFGALATVECFLLAAISYDWYLASLLTFVSAGLGWAVLRVPSASGRRKAFSTCSSHLTVVTLFYGMLVAVYMFPRDGTGLKSSKALSLLYTVLTSLLNPLVYSLRNQEVSKACGRVARIV
ncbi:olfactory receptor 11A1-like [Dermochelys coriacea]|uniref:olfactory receptor 11A1-like n=1 Tax=Dermochelys coriacea TaxID=27794 RepID=UPI0018E8601C|nr:olfactory receptor 11A1-like [Dermochelys coriacea]